MNPLQKKILYIFFWIVVAILFWGSLPSFHYAPYGDIGPNVVSVYEIDGEGDHYVSIKKLDRSKIPPLFVDTGKKVAVSIRNDYRGRSAEQLARFTLLVLLVGFALYQWAGKKLVK